MFDIYKHPLDLDGDDEAIADYCSDLMVAFAESPEGDAISEQHGGIGWAHSFLYYALNYLSVIPPDMAQRDVDEILFDLFPRKVSTEAESADAIIDEIRTFWVFLKRQYELPNATAIIESLGQEAKRELRRELNDASNFDPAKSIYMMGIQAGFDMTTQEGLDEFKQFYNASIQSSWAQSNDAIPNQATSGAGRKSSSKIFEGSRLSAADRKSRRKKLRKIMAKPKRNRRKG